MKHALAVGWRKKWLMRITECSCDVVPLLTLSKIIQRSAKVGAQGLVNFITAAAYLFCPSLPAAFMQPGASTIANLCTLEQMATL